MAEKTDRLLPATLDIRSLSDAVQDRFIQLFDFHAQVKGFNLAPPAELDRDLVRWREMVARFRLGDFRAKESEITALKTVAQWTVDENAKLRNQKQVTVQWQQ